MHSVLTAAACAPEQAKQLLAWGAEGVIVGSALVKALGDAPLAEGGAGCHGEAGAQPQGSHVGSCCVAPAFCPRVLLLYPVPGYRAFNRSALPIKRLQHCRVVSLTLNQVQNGHHNHASKRMARIDACVILVAQTVPTTSMSSPPPASAPASAAPPAAAAAAAAPSS